MNDASDIQAAISRVEAVRRIVAAQRERVEELKREGGHVNPAESLLRTYEGSLRVMEEDLADLIASRSVPE